MSTKHAETEQKFQLKVVINWPYEEEAIPSRCQVLEMPDTWVSDALKEKIREWCPGCPVMISAPTGRGKTTFTADIVKFCCNKTPSKKVLLLVNRTAIATQQKRELTAKLGSKWAAVEDVQALQLTDTFDDIGLEILTYQSFAAHYIEMDLKKFEWVILDEAHFFLEDSVFNSHLDQIFWKLPMLFSHAHRIYMTATPGKVLPEICRAEHRNIADCNRCTISSLCKFGSHLFLYEFPRNFDRIHLFYYRNLQEIVSLIMEHLNDKFLVFTSKREYPIDDESKSYIKLIQKEGISAGYLDSCCKDTDLWRRVCEKGSFDANVLVCTSVLDCGVSLCDDKIKHIVVESTDKTEFLQIIGRKRLKPNENVNVYLRVPDAGKLKFRLFQVREKLKFIQDADRKIANGQTDSLLFSAWNDESSERLFAHLLNYKGHVRVERKETAYQYLKWQEGTLKKLLCMVDELGDDSALPRLAHEWLEQPDGYDETHWLDYDQKSIARAKLIAFLEDNLEKPINEGGWKEFSDTVKMLCAAVRTVQHDADRDLKYLALNNRLKGINLSYFIAKTNNIYTVKKTEEENDENR